ncbi:metal ABC transporter solute-binding protein, Zn/Mn family [Motiliproteus sp. MSK22-1]|uniref:metal ABC transporter solute-binding protein, Zn/Mn family n=1 Tax=Motiliproteus sp. MSK22-1 TaxID=1897630 RepID=UPI0009761988|nr:zinc ABC transporter substrate-binding protein [Motiliproteus sp. MSK22-1]OMH33666.1 ABC transporter substrate-binding protein [Motiliproteus sp. MSK22-1]
MRSYSSYRSLFFVLVMGLSSVQVGAAERLRVGITLHPYFSYVSQIVKERAEVVPLVDAGFNPHSYEMQPADLKRLMTMDALVVNGIGHDEFAFRALDTLQSQRGKSGGGLKVIEANADVPLLGVANALGAWNPHTFVSISASIRQLYTIARELGELDPENAQFYKINAVKFARELRRMKTSYSARLMGLDLSGVRIASTHNAYGYFLQEFGIGIDTVIEPAHGVEPSVSQLQQTIDRIRAADIQILFTELNMDNRYVTTIEQATGIRIYHFSHMTYGEYDSAQFKREMEGNLETLMQALEQYLSRLNKLADTGGKY